MNYIKNIRLLLCSFAMLAQLTYCAEIDQVTKNESALIDGSYSTRELQKLVYKYEKLEKKISKQARSIQKHNKSIEALQQELKLIENKYQEMKNSGSSEDILKKLQADTKETVKKIQDNYNAIQRHKSKVAILQEKIKKIEQQARSFVYLIPAYPALDNSLKKLLYMLDQANKQADAIIKK